MVLIHPNNITSIRPLLHPNVKLNHISLEQKNMCIYIYIQIYYSLRYVHEHLKHIAVVSNMPIYIYPINTPIHVFSIDCRLYIYHVYTPIVFPLACPLLSHEYSHIPIHISIVDCIPAYTYLSIPYCICTYQILI